MILASAIVLLVLGILIVALSSWGVLAPQGLVRFVRTFMDRPVSMVVAVGVRIVLAVVLWLTASVSKTPLVFQVLAGLSLLGALAIALAGAKRVSRLMARVAAWPPLAIRLQCLLGVAFGAFLIWSIAQIWGVS